MANDAASDRGRAGGNALTSFHDPVSHKLTDDDPADPVSTARNRSSADRASPPMDDVSPPAGFARLGSLTAGSISVASSLPVARPQAWTVASFHRPPVMSVRPSAVSDSS